MSPSIPIHSQTAAFALCAASTDGCLLSIRASLRIQHLTLCTILIPSSPASGIMPCMVLPKTYCAFRNGAL